jgi:hypothetical protein
MAANYQMELTPEADYQMLLHNKEVFINQNEEQESVYSNNQYADPVEAISTRNLTQNQIQNNIT